MTNKPITRDSLAEWSACWLEDADGEERIAALVPPEGLSVSDALSLAEAGTITVDDAFWVVLREECLSARTLRLFACDCASRALALAGVTDQRCWRAIEVAERYAMGVATESERARAWSAARDAWDAAWSARDAWAAARDAWAAAWAARAAARDASAAARDARGAGGAGDAEARQQIADLRRRMSDE